MWAHSFWAAPMWNDSFWHPPVGAPAPAGNDWIIWIQGE
jgi:hypothetical protein